MSVFASCRHQITIKECLPCWFDFGDALSWGVLCPQCRVLYEVKAEDLPEGLEGALIQEQIDKEEG